MWRNHRMILPAVTAFQLAACGTSERDEIADRMEQDIAPEHTRDAGERRRIAETLADDAMALRQEAQRSDISEADAALAIESQDRAAADLIARDCEMMRLELGILQRPSKEIRTPEEIAGIPATIEDLNTRLQQNCEAAR